ncbi:methyl-accepting chemotaxis protein, partial [Escherichia coli]|nr:methyl-accepting chemotaxis protein [Escherichia coli]
AHLAGGQVYPYVVPLLDGRPSVALPWVVFSLISSVSADVMGGEAMTTVIKTMDDIADSTQRIGTITSLINDIAFQTNILALN